MQERKQQERLWSPLERHCLSLLQQTKSRPCLLQIHAFMLRNALELNPYLLAKFILTCTSLALNSAPLFQHARKVFDQRPLREDAFICNSMIKAHLGIRQFSESFALYRDLRRDCGFLPNGFTFITLAKAASLSNGVLASIGVHCNVVKFGFFSDLYVSTGLVDMYAKLGMVGYAKCLFNEMPERSQVTWTALIGGYLRGGDMVNARMLFDEMPGRDVAAFNGMIDGYVKQGDMASARSLFDEMPERNVISWTTMIYGNCKDNDVDSARLLFDAMPEKNLFSWNAMIGGYCQNKKPHEALELFRELQERSSLEPDEVTIVSILPAIADLGALDLGNWIHQYVRRKKMDREINIGTALVDMYAKCGEVKKAEKVFNEMPKKEIFSWNALLNGFAINGCAKEALDAFSVMQQEGFKPNEVTLLGVLSACNHCGLVDEGRKWFNAMEEYELVPQIEHYGCMVDLLGRAGYVEEAERLINSMPYEANAIILSSFLAGCGFRKDIMRAARVLNDVAKLEPYNDGNYIMLRNLYAMEGRWEEADEIKGFMRKHGVRKEVGCSVIKIDGRVWEFISGDKVHPQWEAINVLLWHLLLHMKG